MATEAPVPVGFAAHLELVDGSSEVYRWNLNGTAFDSFAEVQVPPRLVGVSGPVSAFTDPLRLLFAGEGVTLTVVHEEGQFYQAMAEGRRFEDALLRLFLVQGFTYDGDPDGPDLRWQGTAESQGFRLTDTRLTIRAVDPTNKARKRKLPKVTLNRVDTPDLPERSEGHLLPIWSGWFEESLRIVEAKCYDRNTGDVVVIDTADADGNYTLPLDEVRTFQVGDPAIDGNYYLVDSRNVPGNDLEQIRYPPHRRTIPHNDTSARNRTLATFRVDLPIDNSQGKENEVEVTSLGGSSERHRDAIPPGTPTDSNGQRIAQDFRTDFDRIFGKQRLGSQGRDPNGDETFQWSHQAQIAWTIFRYLAGVKHGFLDHDSFFHSTVWADGTFPILPHYCVVFMDQKRPVETWIKDLLLELGFAIRFKGGKIQALADPISLPDPADVDLTLGPRDIVPGSMEIQMARWGNYYNEVNLQTRGHTLDRNLPPIESAQARRPQTEIDDRGLASLDYEGWYLQTTADGLLKSNLQEAADRILDVASADQLTVVFKARPATLARRRLLVEKTVGDVVNLTWAAADPTLRIARHYFPWIAEESPVPFRIVRAEPDLRDWSAKLTAVTFPGFLRRWVEEDPVLPTEFAGLAGYADGDASVWKAGWADEIKRWVLQNMMWWTDDNGFIDAGDPDSLVTAKLAPGG